MKIEFCCGAMEECFTEPIPERPRRERLAYLNYSPIDGTYIAGFSSDTGDLGTGDACPYCGASIEISTKESPNED